MIAVLDIGNTNIVVGVFRNEELVIMERISTDRNITDFEYATKLLQIFDINGYSIEEVTGSIISSVVPDVTERTSKALERLIKKKPLIVSHKMKTGLKIEIDNPAQLGNDLIVDAVAVAREYKLPAAFVDMGTATTISVVGREGVYKGGVIIPGTRVSLDSLCSRTAQLPNINIEEPEHVIGKNTVECMKSGILYGSAAQIDGIIDRMEEEMGEELCCVATGGIASLIVPYCRRNIKIDNSLLLKGLYILYKENKE